MKVRISENQTAWLFFIIILRGTQWKGWKGQQPSFQWEISFPVSIYPNFFKHESPIESNGVSYPFLRASQTYTKLPETCYVIFLFKTASWMCVDFSLTSLQVYKFYKEEKSRQDYLGSFAKLLMYVLCEHFSYGVDFGFLTNGIN